jgi:hypothetical protein
MSHLVSHRRAVVYRLRGDALFKRFKEIEITGHHAGSLAFEFLQRYVWETMEQST